MPASLADLQQMFAARVLGESHGDERLQIYTNMHRWRQTDSLLEDFPKIAALSGDGFYDLCQGYLSAHPSQHFSLARLGCSLAQYLGDLQPMRTDLSAMAALEWARCEVFDEANAPTLSALQLTDAEQGLTIVPALRTLWLDHDVAAVWKAIEDGSPIPDPQPISTCVVVWRKGFDVFHVRLAPLEAEAFTRAVKGQSLSQICETFVDQPAPIDAALRVIGGWLAEGWIAQEAT